MDIPNEVVSILISILGTSGLTALLFKALGQKMIEAQFAKSLESYKFKINSRFDRISKIHEKEFELLPVVWNATIQTNSAFYRLVSYLQYYPNLDNMTELETQELFEKERLSTSERDRILAASNRRKEYEEIDYWRKFRMIGESLRDFDIAYQCNKIFLVKELEENMNSIRRIFIEMFAILENANIDGVIDRKFKATANTKQEELNPFIDNLGKLIQKRLCFHEAYE